MVSWEEFETSSPEIAALGRAQLFQFGVGLAFLATVRMDGAPRVHPVCPILCEGQLYVFVPSESPKRADLVRDGRYALQAFPPPKEESEEFYMAGRVSPRNNPELRRKVAAATKSLVREGEALFEFHIERAMHTRWINWGTPELQPVHLKWKASLY